MKSLARRLFRKAGYELRRYKATSSERAQLMAVLNHLGIDMVLDVGANTGGFAKYLRELGYAGCIVSFEPLQSTHGELLSAAEGDKRWIVASRAAIGAENGEVDMHIAANSESSSVQRMLAAHERTAPGSAYVGIERVPLRTLDTQTALHVPADSKVFVKIDTQGYEVQVLQGALETLARSAAVQVELSLVHLYEGQKLMPEMIEVMQGLGFDLWGLAPVFSDPSSGRVLQMDGLFCRSA